MIDGCSRIGKSPWNRRGTDLRACRSAQGAFPTNIRLSCLAESRPPTIAEAVPTNAIRAAAATASSPSILTVLHIFSLVRVRCTRFVAARQFHRGFFIDHGLSSDKTRSFRSDKNHTSNAGLSSG